MEKGGARGQRHLAAKEDRDRFTLAQYFVHSATGNQTEQRRLTIAAHNQQISPAGLQRVSDCRADGCRIIGSSAKGHDSVGNATLQQIVDGLMQRMRCNATRAQRSP